MTDPFWNPDPDRAWHAPKAHNEIPDHNPNLMKHFWIVGLAFAWTPNTIHLDQENQVAVTPPHCAYCHSVYNTKNLSRLCPGKEPPEQ